MYTHHFGLTALPFSASPDPRFLYENWTYREAFATLLYGVRERKGFIVLTGEVGTGKTTLLRRLMDELAGHARFVFFYNTTLTFEELVEVVCSELAIPVEGFTRVKKLRLLNEFLVEEAARGGSVILLLDEAQNLTPEVLENLRLISNLETAREKLLQIVLVGQPELQAKLDEPGLRQVKQRIAMRFGLKPVPDEEIEAFIRHRLLVAGRSRQDLFTSDAIRRITVYANGLPRLVNIICDAALLLAFAAGARTVNGKMIDEAAADLELKPRAEPTGGESQQRRLGLGPRPAKVRAAGRPRWPWIGTAVGVPAALGVAAVSTTDLMFAAADLARLPGIHRSVASPAHDIPGPPVTRGGDAEPASAGTPTGEAAPAVDVPNHVPQMTDARDSVGPERAAIVAAVLAEEPPAPALVRPSPPSDARVKASPQEILDSELREMFEACIQEKFVSDQLTMADLDEGVRLRVLTGEKHKMWSARLAAKARASGPDRPHHVPRIRTDESSSSAELQARFNLMQDFGSPIRNPRNSLR